MVRWLPQENYFPYLLTGEINVEKLSIQGTIFVKIFMPEGSLAVMGER